MVPAPAPSFPSGVSLRPRDALVEEIAQLTHGASYEIAARDTVALQEAAAHIAPGATISITWMPSDTHEDRVTATRAVREAGYEPVPHIAARRIRNEADANDLLARLADAGARRLFLIAGDVPKPIGDLASSLELVGRLRKSLGAFEAVGFGGYPEGHPAIPDATLQSELETKIAVVEDAGLSPFIITQFCFNAAPILAWLAALREHGSTVPVRIGLAGPASIRTLLRFARVCGVGNSARALAGNSASIARLLRETGPDPVIRKLAEADVRKQLGPVALHFFPFGGLARTAQWVAPVTRGQIRLQPSSSGFQPLS